MENNYFWALLVMALMVGGVFGAMAFPRSVVEEVSVDKIVYKDVVKEVPVDRIVKEEVLISHLDKSVEDFLKAAEDEEDEAGNDVDVLECNNSSYEWDEVSFKVEDEYLVEYFDDDKYEVNFTVDLKYKQDDIARCKESWNVLVEYEEDEDTEVSVTLLE